MPLGEVVHVDLSAADGRHEHESAATTAPPTTCDPTVIEPGFVRTATGSALILDGRDASDLHRLGTGERAPAWLAGSGRGLGDVGVRDAPRLDRRPQAARLPRAVVRNGRTVEIQRLIGRSLRGVVDFSAPRRGAPSTSTCDVLQADGGNAPAPRSPAGWSPCGWRGDRLITEGLFGTQSADRKPLRQFRAGSWTGQPLLDLDYSEDSTAEVDANVVMTGDGRPWLRSRRRRSARHCSLGAPRRPIGPGRARD